MGVLAKWVGLAAVGFGAAACAPAAGPAPLAAPVASFLQTQAPLAADTTIYQAVQDGPFAIPAIPLDQLPQDLRRQEVQYPTDEAPGTIIVNTAERRLYFVTGPDRAIRYGIGVGRAGYEWSGLATVASRRPWPTWTPPSEMIARNPALEKWRNGQPGGLDNPLGARALYLATDGVDYGYRIHGTSDWRTIGKSVSAGCIRMFNQDVIDLYNRAPEGAKVIVMTPDGEMPTGLTLPHAKPAGGRTVAASDPEPEPAVAVAEPAMPVLPPLPALDADLVAPVIVPAAAPAAAAPVN